jgi:hypothetical protein
MNAAGPPIQAAPRDFRSAGTALAQTSFSIGTATMLPHSVHEPS